MKKSIVALIPLIVGLVAEVVKLVIALMNKDDKKKEDES